MIEQIFSDGVGTISITGETVRLDLITFSPTETDAGGQPKAVFQQRIVMTSDAFLRSANKVHEAAQVLSKMVANARAAAVGRAESPPAPPPAAIPQEPSAPPPPAAPENEPATPPVPPKRPFP